MDTEHENCPEKLGTFTVTSDLVLKISYRFVYMNVPLNAAEFPLCKKYK